MIRLGRPRWATWARHPGGRRPTSGRASRVSHASARTSAASSRDSRWGRVEGEPPPRQALLAELPAASVRLGDAGLPVDAHHVVDPAGLQPCEQAGAGEAAVGQDDRAGPWWQDGQDRGQGVLLELVSAVVGGHPVAVVADLQQRQRPPAPRHGDPQDLVAGPAAAGAPAAGQDGAEHRPVHAQREPPWAAEPGDRVADEGGLDRDRADAGGWPETAAAA
jgi:hypothetical protein